VNKIELKLKFANSFGFLESLEMVFSKLDYQYDRLKIFLVYVEEIINIFVKIYRIRLTLLDDSEFYEFSGDQKLIEGLNRNKNIV
jgi:hypothetical protein